MSKRFTETGKWSDPWYRGLSVQHKALWQWLLDNCDCAGVLPEIDWDLASFQIGYKCNSDDVAAYGDRIEQCGKGFWIPKFIVFQVGQIDLHNPSMPHRGVLKALQRAGIEFERVTKGLPKGLLTLKDKDKDKDKDKVRAKAEPLPEPPPELVALPDFSEHWKQWLAYRKQIKKPLTAASAQQQYKFLLERKEIANQILSQSIMQGWQGLFDIRLINGAKMVGTSKLASDTDSDALKTEYGANF